MEDSFYKKVLSGASISPSDKVLVVCGGSYDKQMLTSVGVKHAVISNVDFHAGVTDYAPYEWSYQDAENLTVGDRSVDWCVVNAGLHHCASPHRALCEMLRVSRKGIVVIESRDSVLMQIATRFKLTNMFELQVAALSDGQSGGYRNTKIPNYIYRWTERDVEKAVMSYHPERRTIVEHYYSYSFPAGSLSMSRSFAKRLIGKMGRPLLKILEVLLPRQGNCFGFVVRKNGKLQPWLQEANGEIDVNMNYIRNIYSPEKYKRGA
jgi:ubiquinone/menaquinone biosynthesis C-methylase UbiE